MYTIVVLHSLLNYITYLFNEYRYVYMQYRALYFIFSSTADKFENTKYKKIAKTDEFFVGHHIQNKPRTKVN